jgi:hypothetical protein
VAGELRAVDRAGRLYVHAAADHDDVQVYVRGAASARLPGVAAMTLWPSPDGTRIAAFAPRRLVMLSAAGEVRWTAGHWGGARLAWLPGGELVLQFPSGVARVDLDTGALTERRCGWGFGLHELPVDVGASAPTICDAAR